MSMKYATGGSASASWVLKCTDLPQFDALAAAADQFRSDDKLHLRLLCNDSARCAGLIAVQLSAGQRKLILDYSRQRVTGETMELLFDLADAVGLTERREAMLHGERINVTDDMPVLHHVLRMPVEYNFVATNERGSKKVLEGPFILKQVHVERQKIADFAAQVRSGQYLSVTGKPFRHILCVGVGGHHLGPEWVTEALRSDPVASKQATGRTLHFLGNLDPIDFHQCIQAVNAEETMVIVVSRTFMTSELEMMSARTVKNWLIEKLATATTSIDDDDDDDNGVTAATDGNAAGIITAEEVVATHMLAVTAFPQRCQKFGIDGDNVYTIPDWVNARFSICCAVGLLPLSLQYSYEVMCDFLKGAHNMDEHFFHAPLRDNIPVILGLLGLWNSTFLGHCCKAILPYSQALNQFPSYLQNLDMESNGKRVALDGTPLLHLSGEVVLGDAGSTAQTSFYQLMHQGRVVPADFIGFMESQQPEDVPGEAISNHDELMSHFFAQPDTLAYGKSLVDVAQEGVPEPLREHMVSPGNRPSSMILMTRLDAYAAGQLMALYEHRTVVQGFIWGLNSFDHYGADLGIYNYRHIRSQLSASRKTGASVQGFNTATSVLLDHYLAHGRN
jgi:glucose-6-phosphate isomerase